MAYKKVGWKDYPDKTTPINAANLSVMDEGIAQNDMNIGDMSKISDIGDGTLAGAVEKIKEDNEKLEDSKLGFVRLLQKNEDLDNRKEPGVYIAYTEVAKTLVNSQFQNAFIMLVYEADGTVYQEQTRVGVRGKKAMRAFPKDLATWLEWDEFSMKRDLETAISNLQEQINDKLVNIFGVSYELTETAKTPGDGWSVSDSRAFLRGNTLSYRFEAGHEEGTAIGDIANITIATVTFEHDGKIKFMPVAGGVTSRVGGIGTLYVTNANVTSTTVTFAVMLCATDSKLKNIAGYIDIPVTLNVNAY